jgi:hypothetical protein
VRKTLRRANCACPIFVKVVRDAQNKKSAETAEFSRQFPGFSPRRPLDGEAAQAHIALAAATSGPLTPVKFEPTAVITAMIATEINAPIKAYSMAVVPPLSRQSLYANAHIGGLLTAIAVLSL